MNHLAEEVCPLGGTSSHVRNVLDFNPDADPESSSCAEVPALEHCLQQLWKRYIFSPLSGETIKCKGGNFPNNTLEISLWTEMKWLFYQRKFFSAREEYPRWHNWKFSCEQNWNGSQPGEFLKCKGRKLPKDTNGDSLVIRTEMFWHNVLQILAYPKGHVNPQTLGCELCSCDCKTILWVFNYNINTLHKFIYCKSHELDEFNNID